MAFFVTLIQTCLDPGFIQAAQKHDLDRLWFWGLQKGLFGFPTYIIPNRSGFSSRSHNPYMKKNNLEKYHELPQNIHYFLECFYLSHEKKPPTFQYTGWSIGILIMAYYNPYIAG